MTWPATIGGWAVLVAGALAAATGMAMAEQGQIVPTDRRAEPIIFGDLRQLETAVAVAADFCGAEEGIALIVSRTIAEPQPQSENIVVTRRLGGVEVVIHPAPDVAATRDAVGRMSMFFAVGARDCPSGERIWPMLSIGVAGLGFAHDKDGEVVDFHFQSGSP